MSYNHGKEERKWQRWKLAEEKVLRACGMDESTIEQLHLWDRAMFNSDRRFYEKLQDTGKIGRASCRERVLMPV